MVALPEVLDLILRPHGVRACALYPGFTHTKFHAAAELLERKTALPDSVWYDAEVVVREGRAAIERGNRVYVSRRLCRRLDPVLQSVRTLGRWPAGCRAAMSPGRTAADAFRALPCAAAYRQAAGALLWPPPPAGSMSPVR